jgi:hypothetical protein
MTQARESVPRAGIAALLVVAIGCAASAPAIAQKAKPDPIAYTDQKVAEEAALRAAADQTLTQKATDEAATRAAADQALSSAQIALRADVDALAATGGGLRVYDATGKALGSVVGEGLFAMKANTLLLPIAMTQDPASAKGATLKRVELKFQSAALHYESTDCSGQAYIPLSVTVGFSNTPSGVRVYAGLTSVAAVYAAPGGAPGAFRAYVSTNTTASLLRTYSFLESTGCVPTGTALVGIQGFPVTSVYDFTVTEPLSIR